MPDINSRPGKELSSGGGVTPPTSNSGANALRPEAMSKDPSTDSATPSVGLPSLSAPKGGGAVRSIGEKFSANAATGTASLSVPIATSPGRGGFALGLALRYDSGAGNGPFGVGWQISAPSITRKTDKGLPRYLDDAESDVFLLSGAEDLVPVHGGELTRGEFRVVRYRPRVEQAFARIDRWTHRDTGDVHWRTTTGDNVTSIYGLSRDAQIADPADPRRVFSWRIEETRDDRGNVVRYTYKAEDAAGVDPGAASEAARFPDGAFHATAQRYLKRIEYGNHKPGDTADWLFEVVFDYGEHDEAVPTPCEARPWPARQDAFSTYRAGFEVRTYRLCRRVLMFHRFDELGPEPYLVRSTDLAYEHKDHLSALVQVTQAGYLRDEQTGAYERATLPPLELAYIERKIHDEVRAIEPSALDGIPGGVDGASARWVDLDGEGISGVLLANNQGWYYKANLGQGQLASPALLRSLPVPAALASGVQQLTDLAGEGQLDLVQYGPPVPGYFTRTADGDWTPFTPFRALPRIDWRDPNLRFLDVDGDGLADVLITEDDALVWYRSRGKAGFEPPLVLARPKDEERGAAVVFHDGTETIQLADMTGDGLIDIVRVRNGELCYWPNLGYGRFGRKITMDRSPWFAEQDQFDPRRIRLADLDGSGTADVIYLGHEGVRLWFNESGNRLSEPVTLDLPLPHSAASINVVDLLGNGTACLVWSSPLAAEGTRPLCYVDLMGGQKPHLLVSTKNNLGAETRVHYATSTRFYLADKARGTPWITRLPFPVHVVERVETYDRISRNRFVVRYAYHHGYFDGVEREFRGFGMVEQWDTEEIAALNASAELPRGDNFDAASQVPPVWTKTWFHTGAFVERERISRLFEREYYREPGLSDAQFRAQLLPDTTLDPRWEYEDAREACRALRGALLRQEVYALDGSPKSARPYSVSERDYTLVRIQPSEHGHHAIFFAHARETIDYHYEREPADPRVQHALTLEVDAFGTVRRSAAVGYGRRRSDPGLSEADQAEQRKTLVTSSENDVTNAIDSESTYRTPFPAESRAYELTGLELPAGQRRFAFAEILAALNAASPIPYEATPAAGQLEKRLVARTRALYRRDDLSGALPLGRIEPLALPYESYRLALTRGLVAAVYGDRVTDAMLEAEGRYVHGEGDDDWWVPSGRVFYSADAGDAPDQELAHARRHFFLPRRFQDPFGASATVRYDAHDLLALETRDALANCVTVGVRDDVGTLVENGNDYRVLQPRLVMDPNRNRAAAAFDALGLVVGTAVMGKPEEHLGDSLEGFQPDLPESVIVAHLGDPFAGPHGILRRATTRIVYDLFAYQRTQGDPQPQPAVVYTLARETHDADLAPGQKTRVQHGFAYSDGFGRVIQSKAQAEPGPLIEGGPAVRRRWVGSGWIIFNNKGKPVRQYEPFFSATHRFEFANIVGVSSILFYDPLGRTVGTLHPDHTYEKVVFDPWRQASWDVNDTVLETDPTGDPDVGDFFRRLLLAEYLPTWYEQRQGGAMGPEEQAAASKAAVHARTPSVAYFDTLGRPFLGIAYNRFRRRDQFIAEEKYVTRVRLDIQGNQREVVDAKDRAVMRYAYDVLGNGVHRASMESGERWILPDVAGTAPFAWDSRNHVFRTEYDALRRPTRGFVKGADPSRPDAELLCERVEYGEGQADDVRLNLRTRAYRSYDAAGVVTNVGKNPATGLDEAYDFKGNSLRTSRQLAVEYKRTLDWSRAVPLEEEIYRGSATYDALNRSVEIIAPDESRLLPTYNEANLLARIDAALRGSATATTFVEHVAYNVRGQREVVEFGNGAKTAYAYDPLTFRLARLYTTRGNGAVALQDLHYVYDPTGNITRQRDDAQQTLYFRNQRVDPSADYTYDAIYRLIEATGREHLGQAADGDLAPVPTSFSDAPRVYLPHPSDGNAMGRYRERYLYDEVGNLLEMIHRGTDPSAPNWRRTYSYDDPSLLEGARTSNRLTRTRVGTELDLSYTYDAHGNMSRMPHLPLMRWDAWDQLQATAQQTVSHGGTLEITYYVYDSSGQRLRKVTERQAAPGVTATRKAERIYLGGLEIYREYEGDGAIVKLERETLCVVDGAKTIALVDTRTQGSDGSPEQLVRYQFDNHLGSACLELDAEARVSSYEEYYPYGSTSYQAVRSRTEAPKRYRYTGKERDEESGLYYHGARYYAPWIGRWTSADPAELVDGVDVYVYGRNNPITYVDPGGFDSERPPQGTPGRDDPLNYSTFEEYRTGAASPWSTEYLQEKWNEAHPAQAESSSDDQAEPSGDGQTELRADDLAGPAVRPYLPWRDDPNWGVPDPSFGTGQEDPDVVAERRAQDAAAAVVALNPHGNVHVDHTDALIPIANAVVQILMLLLPEARVAEGMGARTLGEGLETLTSAEADYSLSMPSGGGSKAFDPDKLAKIQRNLKGKVEFRVDPKWLDSPERLDAFGFGPEAAYDVSPAGGSGTIILRPEPSRAAVIEELTHWAQHRAAGFPGAKIWGQTRQVREMYTQVKLANLKLIGWTNDEWTSFNVNWHRWRTGR